LKEEEDLIDYRIVNALFELSVRFSQYVMEVDPELWKRGMDYAKTYAKGSKDILIERNDDDKQ